MRKIYALQSILIALITFFCVNSIHAELILSENFEYDLGKLNVGSTPAQNHTQWFEFSAGSSNIEVVDSALTYPQYQDTPEGKAVQLAKNGADDLRCFPTIQSGNVYMAAIIRISAPKESTIADCFLTLGNGESSDMYARIYAKSNATKDKVKFGISKSNESASYINFDDTEYSPNTPILLIAKYKFVEGERNDTTYLFINPVINGIEPECTIACKQEAVSGWGSQQGANAKNDATFISSVNLRQGKDTPNITIDAIRIATAWEDLFATTSSTDKPAIHVSPLTIDMGYPFTEDVVTQTINIKAEHLTGDIAVGGISGDLQASTATISKEDAMSEEGFDLTLTLTANAEGKQSQTLTLSSEGAETVSIPVSWFTNAVINVESLAELREMSESATEYDLFRIKNEVAISHITKDNIYIQDETSAFAISDVYEMLTTTYTSGDRIKNLIGNATKAFGQSLFYPRKDFGAPIRNEAVEPTVTTLAQMQATPVNYESRLVRVNDVTFLTTGTFSTSQIDIEQEGTTAKLSIFANSDFIGNEIPAKADLIGISRSSSNINIAPRSSEDIIVNIPDGIESVSATDRVWSTHNTLHIETVSPQTVEIYSILGKQIVRQEVSGEASFALPGGVYLVKIGAQTGKYIVK